MRKFSLAVVALWLLSTSANVLFAQGWRGEARISGLVTDTSGKPVKGAKVTIVSLRGNVGPPPLTTDKNGKWSIIRVIGGNWNIDVEAEGYMPKKGTMEIAEGAMNPPVKTTLEPLPQQVAQPDEATQPEQSVASSVPPEAVDAVRKGEDFLRAASGFGPDGAPLPAAPTADEKTMSYKMAVVEFEMAQALIPDNIQLKQALAKAYYGAGNVKQAIALLQQVYDAEPTNNGVLLLLVNLLIEDGQLEQGKAMLDKVPAGTMTDPGAMINIGILLLNKNKLSDAYGYFDKAVTLDPIRGESYYFRGLASLQMQKMKEAKADFQKTVELSPDSQEAKDARDLLKQMK